VQPGSGRLGAVSAYFRLSGIAGALGTTLLAADLFAPSLPVRSSISNPVIALAAAALVTFGFFRTSQLLDRRQKSGATMAGLCFIGPMIGYATGAAPSLSTLIVSGLGLALVASVWRHLE
jgi:hypothetical protein